MDSFYEGLKDMKDCLYVDLDSESSDKMLYKCSNAVSKKINNALEKKDVVEGFSSNCCPDGTTNINNNCVQICKNCKYNDCNTGSSNIGNFYKSPVIAADDKKGIKNMNDNEQLFNYIILDVPDN
tara:strand:- start:4025 stop:4399 length:375 start_codon:yes stop_codon:yes gene_type:complete